MCPPSALPFALDPLSAPPPNISHGGLAVDHMTAFNVRRGGARKRKEAENRCPLPGLISRDRMPKTCQKAEHEQATSPNVGSIVGAGTQTRRRTRALRMRACAINVALPRTTTATALGDVRARNRAVTACRAGSTIALHGSAQSAGIAPAARRAERPSTSASTRF